MSDNLGARRDGQRLTKTWWVVGAVAITLGGVALVAATLGDSGPSVAGDASGVESHADSIITLDSAKLRLADIELLTPTPSVSDALVANGTITYDANHVSIVSPRTEGRIATLRADLGQQVREGDVLAELESSEVGQMRGDLARARVNMDVAKRNYDREKRLYEQSITPQKELLEAENAFRSAQADVDAGVARLAAVGATEGQGAAFGLVTPIGGTVVERNVNPGQVVGPSSSLFTVANLRHVWITVDVYEADLSRVQAGAAVTVAPAALPEEYFNGRVTYAGGIVDPASRTFKVRAELENTALRLRPGMFAQVRIATPQGRARPAAHLTLPEIAVQEVNGKQVVFVVGARPGQFIVRPVTLGPRLQGGLVTIASGIAASDTVVGRGAFQLKAEIMKSSFGEGH